MAQDLASFIFRTGRTRAFWTIAVYGLMDLGVLVQLWLQQAPDALSEVSWKGWVALACSVLVGQAKQIRSLLNRDLSSAVPPAPAP